MTGRSEDPTPAEVRPAAQLRPAVYAGLRRLAAALTVELRPGTVPPSFSMAPPPGSTQPYAAPGSTSTGGAELSELAGAAPLDGGGVGHEGVLARGPGRGRLWWTRWTSGRKPIPRVIARKCSPRNGFFFSVRAKKCYNQYQVLTTRGVTPDG
jgi:hypothetical protein